jgi:hypothetical protein
MSTDGTPKHFSAAHADALAALGEGAYEAAIDRGSMLAPDASLAYARDELDRGLVERRWTETPQPG